MAGHDDIPELALDWHRAGRAPVIATVLETWGSAPRPAGSQLVIADDGEMMGSVSGGCVEGAVIAEAAEARADGRPRILTFGVSDDEAFAVGLACGGTIRVLVEPVGSALPEAVLADLVAARADRQPVALVFQPERGGHRLAGPEEAAVAARLRSDRSGLEEDGRFIGIHNPPLRLVVVGAVHIAQPLVAMARIAGYGPTLIDPRSAFGSEARFPGETILDGWPDEALAELAPDARTAVVTLTHDPKLDDPAILAAFDSPAFYIGCLGSPRTHAKRLDRLRAAGVPEAQIARIHAPVGLDIGARSPAEIALSILAQITERLRRG
ncbi:XdhC family protein [Cereibacter johrii]|uniref:Xanthine dehydrogenase accessory factor n=1 Tax=Cereibacter johrii TaxID=445629 RepID=A0ABX5JH32_9RHOB|nr:XdhC family protein [Cereibacter johrii]ODM41715.1 XdhC/CoxI family protein [Cereibacter johrii]PTM81364.1 xanthine dehydrogenase accessory factor [Cereibacter johrii]